MDKHIAHIPGLAENDYISIDQRGQFVAAGRIDKWHHEEGVLEIEVTRPYSLTNKGYVPESSSTKQFIIVQADHNISLANEELARNVYRESIMDDIGKIVQVEGEHLRMLEIHRDYVVLEPLSKEQQENNQVQRKVSRQKLQDYYAIQEN